jgi:phosphoesterase RecJ-like protein
VTARTMQIAGKLMEKGIDFTNIIDNTFYMRTYRQSQVLGKALLESVQFCDGRCIFTVLTKRDMEFYGVTSKDLGGVVEQLRLNDTVEVAIFLYETEKNEYKVSMRSKNIVDVSKIAKRFGGGGHIRAAGFDMAANDPRDIINNIGALVELQFNSAQR